MSGSPHRQRACCSPLPPEFAWMISSPFPICPIPMPPPLGSVDSGLNIVLASWSGVFFTSLVRPVSRGLHFVRRFFLATRGSIGSYPELQLHGPAGNAFQRSEQCMEHPLFEPFHRKMCRGRNNHYFALIGTCPASSILAGLASIDLAVPLGAPEGYGQNGKPAGHCGLHRLQVRAGPALLRSLPERDECEHSHKSAAFVMKPPDQNWGPATPMCITWKPRTDAVRPRAGLRGHGE